jgi:hypothetical protein
VLIAWGTASGRNGENTIGRDSASLGHARVQVGSRFVETDRNWAEVPGLEPDTPYTYRVQIGERTVGQGSVRTWPVRANRLVFFVIGDYGSGSGAQRQVAEAMRREFERREQAGDPVRFVLTLGDNIYADVNLGYLIAGSGDQDSHWERKFYQPYREVLRHIPFLPTLGNHDGNSSENRGDLAVYLDNFFFPGNHPARWYTFSVGGLAQFFALDSTANSTGGHPAPAFNPGGDQSNWLARELAASRLPWKIPYFHHPPFNAGPGHGASLAVLSHWVDLFRRYGVRVVFSGHEHNFQFSEDSDATGHIRYFVSGSGGQLRAGDVRANMPRAHMEGWAAQYQFVVVEIEGGAMHVTPLSYQPVVVRDTKGKPISMPVEIHLP